MLEDYGDIIRQYVRGAIGVYALYRKNSLYYVGLASNLPTRLASHLRDRHGATWDRFSLYLTLGDSHLKELESLVLRITQPRGNKVKGKFARSVDLRPAFKREIRHAHDVEMTDLFAQPFRIPRARKRTSREPALAPYVSSRFEIRLTHKGVVHKAIVRSDGTIQSNGVTYTSPSVAGMRAIGSRSLNGWTAWKYRNAAGEWIWLDELRKRRPKRRKS
jgi:hypothetical protein